MNVWELMLTVICEKLPRVSGDMGFGPCFSDILYHDESAKNLLKCIGKPFVFQRLKQNHRRDTDRPMTISGNAAIVVNLSARATR